MNQLVIVGGYTEGHLGLKPVHEAISANTCLLEAAAEIVADELDMSLQAVWTVYEALDDPDKFAEAIDGKFVGAHSIGNRAVQEWMKPVALASFGPPEPNPLTRSRVGTASGLAAGAAMKTAYHLRNLLPGGEDRLQTLRILASGAYQMPRHPVHNVRLLAEATQFSTLANNTKLEATGTKTGIIASGMDEFFDPAVYNTTIDRESLQTTSVVAQDLSYFKTVLGARHDDFLAQPEEFTARETLAFLEAIN